MQPSMFTKVKLSSFKEENGSDTAHQQLRELNILPFAFLPFLQIQFIEIGRNLLDNGRSGDRGRESRKDRLAS
jgi:hypothetical protein